MCKKPKIYNFGINVKITFFPACYTFLGNVIQAITVGYTDMEILSLKIQVLV